MISIYAIIDDIRKLAGRDERSYAGLLPVAGYLAGFLDAVLRCNQVIDWGSPSYMPDFQIFVAQRYEQPDWSGSAYLLIDERQGDGRAALGQYFSLVDEFRKSSRKILASTGLLVRVDAEGFPGKVAQAEVRSYFPDRSCYLTRILGDGSEFDSSILHCSIEAAIEHAASLYSIKPRLWSKA